MFARLWWKEARRVWPAWAFLACAGVGAQRYAEFADGGSDFERYAGIAGWATALYLLLVASVAFAGEREDGTLGWLDSLAVGRLDLWWAKASFATVSTLALGAFLWVSALRFAGPAPNFYRMTADAAVWGLVALGWGLSWSALSDRALNAAILGAVSTGATVAATTYVPKAAAAAALPAIALATTAGSAIAFVRAGPPRRERGTSRGAEVVPVEVGPSSRGWKRPTACAVERIAWETWRRVRARAPMMIGATLGAVAVFHLAGWGRYDFGGGLIYVMIVIGVMTGVATFNDGNRRRTHRFLDYHGARPGVVWVVKAATWWGAAVALGTLATVAAVVFEKIDPPLKARPLELPSLCLGGGFVLAFAYSLGALCGMVTRGGAAAGLTAFVAAVVLLGVMGVMAFTGELGAFAFVYLLAAMLAVGWAWSGDWLRYPSGVGKWARLAAWGGLAAAGFAAIRAAGLM